MIKILRDFASRMDRSDGDAGAAFVELALTMPVLALFLLGASEFARTAYAAIEVANAAPLAPRLDRYNSANASNTSGIETAATADAADLQRTYHDILGQRNLLKRGCLHRDWRRLPEYGLPESRPH